MSIESSLSHFYGLNVPDEVDDACDEGLTDQETEDLFAAHMCRNYGYFGAIDKTLSGFVVLSDEGDNAWLYDARDTGGVYFQDHETREITFYFSTLADYLGWRNEAAAAEDNEEDDEDIRARWESDTAPPSTRKVSTETLACRLQWAVWFFAQPMRDVGADSTNRETSSGIGWFFDEIGPDPWALYKEERDAIKNDPHLACSWLLVAAAIADQALIKDIKQNGPRGIALFDAFVDALAPLSVDSTLDVLPIFAHRKHRLLLAIAMNTEHPGAVEYAVRSMQALADNKKCLRVALVAVALAKQYECLNQVRECAKALTEQPVAIAVNALLDAHENQAESPHVSTALTFVGDPEYGALTERATLLFYIAPIATDPRQRLAAAKALLEEDPYHFVSLEIAAKAANTLELPEAAELNAQHAALQSIRPLYSRALSHIKDSKELDAVCKETETLQPDQQALLVRRVLAAPDSFHNQLVNQCLLLSLSHTYPERAQDWKRGLGALGYMGAEKLIKKWRKKMAKPDAAAITDIQAVLAGPIPVSGAPILQEWGRKEIVEALNAWLSTQKGPGAIDGMLDRLEQGDAATKKAIIDSSLNPFDEACVVKKMNATQAVRAANVLVALNRSKQDQDIQLFHSAGHQLYRFSHPGAQDYLIERLQSETGEEVMANLYAAVRGLKTARSREALIERLFTETQHFWRMANAVAEIWTDEIEAQIFAQIERRNNHDGIIGANHAAAAIAQHVKKTQPLVKLGLCALKLTPGSEQEKSQLCYVLLEAGRAALINNQYESARTILDAAQALGVTPQSDYHNIDRKRPWENPFETDAALKALAQDLRSGKLEADQKRAQAARDKSRRSGKAMLKISDQKLSDLAGTHIAQRLFHDTDQGTVWALNKDNEFFYFDGFDVSKPPFTVTLDSTLSDFLADEEAFSQRRFFWTDSAQQFIDVARYGRHVLYCWNSNRECQCLGLVFPTEEAATLAFERVCLFPPKGFIESEPWYVPLHGAIERTFYHPKEDGSYNSKRERVLAIQPEQVAQAEQTILDTAKNHPGMRIMNIECCEGRRRRNEQTVIEAFESLTQVSDMSVLEAARLPKLMGTLLEEAGFENIIQYEEDAAQDSSLLARLDLIEEGPVRRALHTLYQHVGAIRISVGPAFAHLLPLSDIDGPDALLARRGGGEEGFTDVTLQSLVSMGSQNQSRQIAWLLSAFIPDMVATLLPETKGRLCNAPPSADVQNAVLTKTKGSAEFALRVMLDPTRAYMWTAEGRSGGHVSWNTQQFKNESSARKAFTDLIKRRRASGWQ